MKLKRRFLLSIVYLAFLSCLLPAAIYIYKYHACNFDMLGYAALVIKKDRAIPLNKYMLLIQKLCSKILKPENEDR